MLKVNYWRKKRTFREDGKNIFKVYLWATQMTQTAWLSLQPSYEEVTAVIKCLKNHKAPGTDQIIAEFFKKGGEILWRRIHHLIKLIRTQHKILEEWSMGITQRIYKKGNKLECSNYRAITLFNVTYNVLSGILHNRLAKYAEEVLWEYQCVFRADCSTIDHIFAIRQTQEKAYNIPLHNLFIDFKQAFDSVNRGRMLNDHLIFGIPWKLVWPWLDPRQP